MDGVEGPKVVCPSPTFVLCNRLTNDCIFCIYKNYVHEFIQQHSGLSRMDYSRNLTNCCFIVFLKINVMSKSCHNDLYCN